MVLAVAVVTIVQLAGGTARRRGAMVTGLAFVGAAVLLFPFVPSLIAGGGLALSSDLGSTDPWRLLRLTFDAGPATWAPALFLPVASILGLALADGDRRRPAIRAAAVAVAGLALAWASSAGYLPVAVTNTPLYLAMTATAEAFLVAFGLASTLGGLEREAFGFRQVGTALMTVVVAGGIALQALAAMTAEWAIGGPERIPAAWAVVDSTSKGAFRVLWIGDDDGRSFPPPGGDPAGVVEAGTATLRFGLTDRTGMVAVDTGRPLAGPGPDALREAIGEILSGTTVHGGALLAPFGIRYLVADQDQVGADARSRLDAQVDLDVVPQAGLLIWRNAVALPPASVLQADPRTVRIVASDRPDDLQRLAPTGSSPLTQVEGGWSGPSGDGNLAAVSTEFDGAWTLAGGGDPAPAFGWATSFPVSTGTVDIRYGTQLPSTVATWLLAAVWAAALWVTRRPVAR